MTRRDSGHLNRRLQQEAEKNAIVSGTSLGEDTIDMQLTQKRVEIVHSKLSGVNIKTKCIGKKNQLGIGKKQPLLVTLRDQMQ